MTERAAMARRASGPARVVAMRPAGSHTASSSARDVRLLRVELDEYLDTGGYLAWSARARVYTILGTRSPRSGLVRCPSCRTGMLMLVRSRRTRKRFIGCSNYLNGCDASSPLPQRARLRALKQACPECAWPMAIYRYTRTAKWTRMCTNHECPARASP